MSKEAIIDKIYADAQRKADSFVADAQSRADEIIADAAQECKKYLYEQQALTDRMCDDIEYRAKTVAELDAKKMLLGAKSQILNGIFESTLQKLRNLDKDSYLKLLLGMLDKSAQNGDVVTISAREKDILTQEVLDNFASEKGIHLTLSSVLGSFDGGMILSGDGIDKNLTFEVEVAQLREQIETQIAKEIFG